MWQNVNKKPQIKFKVSITFCIKVTTKAQAPENKATAETTLSHIKNVDIMQQSQNVTI